MAQVEFRVPGPGTYIIEAAPSLPPLSQPGTAADVLTGEQFYGEDGNPVTGTMPDNPAEAVIIQGGGSYTIPKGYHTGKGTVTSEGTELPTLANPANAGEIISGKQSIGQNGETLTGTMPNNGAVSKDLTAGEKYIIPAGYHNGQGKVTAPTVASETPGTAEAVDILSGKTAWVNGEQITGSIPTKTAEDVTIQGASVSVPSGYYGPNIAKAIPTVEQTVPTISVSPEGLITAQAQQTEGFVAGGTKSATNQLPVQGAQTITPSTMAQTIQPNVYLTGAQTIQGDTNLVPENIKEAVSIFGVTGTYAGSGSDFAVPLTVTAETGATVKAINGETELTGISMNGVVSLTLTKGGTWIVSATLEGRTDSVSIEVLPSYKVKLAVGPGNLVYHGTAEDLSVKNTGMASASNGKYGVFAGGMATTSNSATQTDIVNAYDAELTRIIAPRLVEAVERAEAAKVGKYIIIAGGKSKATNTFTSAATAFDEDLIKNIPSELNGKRYDFAATSVGDYALFMGGTGTGIDRTAYDATLTRSTPTELSEYRYFLAATNIKGYALFCGGIVGGNYLSNADSYDENLTHGLPTELSVGRAGLAASSNTAYALFGGGNIKNTEMLDAVDAYNSDLTRTIPASLSKPVTYLSATSIGEYVLFGGGRSNSATVDSYNIDLTKTTPPPLSVGRYNLSAVSIGDYALFAGGSTSQGPISTVDVYTIK